MQEDEEIPEYTVVVFDDQENDRFTFTRECGGKKIGKLPSQRQWLLA